MRTSFLLLTTLALASSMAAPEPEPPAAASSLPSWFRTHMEIMTGHGGRWLADNTAYMSATEIDDAYGMEWRWGLGQQSLSGRLFGMRGGTESHTYWEFRAFWHPGDGLVHIHQYGGDGRVGIGFMEDGGEGMTRSHQDFMVPGGGHTRVAHESHESATELRTLSFDVMEDGSRKAGRTYVWRPASAPVAPPGEPGP